MYLQQPLNSMHSAQIWIRPICVSKWQITQAVILYNAIRYCPFGNQITYFFYSNASKQHKKKKKIMLIYSVKQPPSKLMSILTVSIVNRCSFFILSLQFVSVLEFIFWCKCDSFKKVILNMKLWNRNEITDGRFLFTSIW